MTFFTQQLTSRFQQQQQQRGERDPLQVVEPDRVVSNDDDADDEDDTDMDDFDDIDIEKQQQQQRSNNSNSDERWLLRIKSSRDLQIQAYPSDTVASLKQAVLQALATHTSSEEKKDSPVRAASTEASTPYVRLIASGRLLAPDTALLRDFGSGTLNHESVVHAVVSHRRGAQAAAAAPTAFLSSRALRGSGINSSGFVVRRQDEEDDDEEDDSEESEADTEAAVGYQHRHYRSAHRRHERLGFDRLREAIGFRRSEVAAIRAYFNRSVDRWIREHPTAAEQAAAGESDPMRRRLLQEEAWMQSQGPASEFRLNLGGVTAFEHLPSLQQQQQRRHDAMLWRSGGMSAAVGTDRDFMWGFMLGFFVGLLMLLWVWIPTVPHKQKLGILTGISVQLALGMLQGSEPDMVDDLVLSDY